MDRDFTVIFRTDTTQAISGIHAVAAEFKMLESYINTTGSSIGQFNQQLNSLTPQLNNASGGITSVGKASRSMLTDMLAMGAGFLVIEGGIAAIGNLGAMATKARDHIKELAIETMDLREEMRELANLKGAGGPDNEIAGETIKMAMKAGMMPKEMVAYLEQFEGSIPAGEEKGHIDEKTKQVLALEGAKFAGRVKLAPGTGGDLAGVIAQYSDLTKDENGKAVPQEERAARAMAQLGRVEYGLEKGRGKLETLTRSLINTAGAVVSMGGPVEDLGDLAQIQGVASTHANPKESGTRVRQAVRALRDTDGKAGAFLRKTAKINDDDSHVTRLEKIKTQVDIARKNGKQADVFLRGVGFSDEEEMRAVLEQVEDLDIIKHRIRESHKITGKSVMAKDAAFQKDQRTGARRQQKAAKAGQDFLIGEQNEQVGMATENAEQRMRDNGEMGGWKNNVYDWAADLGGLRTWIGGEPSKEARKYYRSETDLVAEAKRVGIDHDKALKLLGRQGTDEGWSLGDPRNERERTKGFDQLATEVTRKGGNPYGEGPNIAPKFDELIREQRETNRILRDNAAKGPAAAGPPIEPLREAAAPKRN